MDRRLLNNLAETAYGEGVKFSADGLTTVLSALPERNLEILNDYYSEGLSIPNMAKKYNTSKDRIRQLIARVNAKIRQENVKKIVLGEYYDGTVTINSSIDKLNLGLEITSLLKRYNINTIHDLVNTPENVILSIPRIGNYKLEKIKKALNNAKIR